MNSDIELRVASEKDIPVITSLADAIWKDHYTPIIGADQVEYMLAKMYSPSSILEKMKEGERYYVASKNSSPIGYIAITKKGAEEFFLNKFYIATSDQAKGFGSSIFRLVLNEIPEMRTMRLQVNRLNYKSINFYFKMGFTIEYAKDFEIGDGYTMDDYVMILRQKDQ